MAPARITVGLVVYNGERYLASAIQSFLDQTFRDFQLIIYDNASTDATPDIAKQYAAIDSRVRVVRHASNMGALRNWNYAVDHCNTPLFCWAAHDDLREPTFLEALVHAFDGHTEAAMSCCDARVIDPDGSRRHVLSDTLSFAPTIGMSSSERVLMYLQGAPASPIFGLYRTEQLRNAIQIFRDAAALDGPLMLWLDIVFLVGFFNRHHVAVVHEPLFLFRRGGVSHRIDLYESMGQFLLALYRFNKWLMPAAHNSRRNFAASFRLRVALWRYYIRTLCSSPVRRMFMHHLIRAMPVIESVKARWHVWQSKPFRRFSRRVKAMPDNTRIVLFGAGKHTRRCMRTIQYAAGGKATIVGVCDDRAASTQPIGSLPTVSSRALHELRPDILLISSDAYEHAMYKRAKQIAPNNTLVWCLYDETLEAACTDRSSFSTVEMKSRIESMASSPS